MTDQKTNIEKLREIAVRNNSKPTTHAWVCKALLKRAADEIERLRAILDAVRNGCKDKSDAWGTYAIGWNAALMHIHSILEANDE